MLVRVTPRAGRDVVTGVGPEGELRARVRAPAADGAANQALLQLLAGELSLPRTAVVLERGTTSRLKRLRLEGIGRAALLVRWPGLAAVDERER